MMKKLIFTLLSCTLLLTACGTSDDTTPALSDAETATVIDDETEPLAEIPEVDEPANNLQAAIMISNNKEKEGTFDGDVIDGYASGTGIFYATNSKGYDYELHANFINGYIDGDSELLYENGNYVYGHYDMGLKDGTFTSYSNEIGEFVEEYEAGMQIGNTKYIKVNDSCIYAMADELLQSTDNPANWSDEEIGIGTISDVTSDEYKTAIANWQNKIDEYENFVFQTCADLTGMTREEAEAAYLRAISGENSYTNITQSVNDTTNDTYPVDEDTSDAKNTDTKSDIGSSIPESDLNPPSDTPSGDDVNPAAETQIAADSQSPSESENGENFNTYDNPEQQETTATYVLNTNTMKIHHPSCSSVAKIAPHNYATSNQSIDELVAQGYDTCKRCF